MLRELRIENLLLIERAELRLGPGLNAITGETGAGKTVLAHSLDLLMGGKAKAGIVRPGADEAWVEGVFDLPAGLLDDPELAELAERLPGGADEVVLGRRVSAGGRTSAFVAGRAATAADLKALGGRLLAFFGQHEHRKLTISSAQMEVLDGFAGAQHLILREEYREAHREVGGWPPSWPSCASGRDRGSATLISTATSCRRSRKSNRIPRSAQALAAERERLRHAEGLSEAAAGAHAGLAGADLDGGGAAGLLAEAEARLAAASGLDSALDALAERVAALNVEVGDVAAELRDYAEGVAADPGGLVGIEERLDAIDRLERKHGGSVESVLAHAERCRVEIARLEGAEERGAEATAALAEAETRRTKLGAKLSAGRKKAAGPLEERVAAELAQLAMDGARLEVVLEPASGGVRAVGSRDGRAARRPQPRHRAGAAPRRGLRRRALPRDAGAQRPRPGGRRRDDGLRRDRRRDRRQYGAGGRRAAAGARHRAPGALHHPPAPGRLARRLPLPAREGHRPAMPRWPRSSGSTARPWSRRSAACSAASKATRPPPSTPESCSPPPDSRPPSAVPCGAVNARNSELPSLAGPGTWTRFGFS